MHSTVDLDPSVFSWQIRYEVVEAAFPPVLVLAFVRLRRSYQQTFVSS